jgi:glucan phosphoethanolaminetransferase (alkaline phosphatase superfamily)
LEEQFKDYVFSINYFDEVLKNISNIVYRFQDHPIAMIYFFDHGDVKEDVIGYDIEHFRWSMACIAFFDIFS